MWCRPWGGCTSTAPSGMGVGGSKQKHLRSPSVCSQKACAGVDGALRPRELLGCDKRAPWRGSQLLQVVRGPGSPPERLLPVRSGGPPGALLSGEDGRLHGWRRPGERPAASSAVRPSIPSPRYLRKVGEARIKVQRSNSPRLGAEGRGAPGGQRDPPLSNAEEKGCYQTIMGEPHTFGACRNGNSTRPHVVTPLVCGTSTTPTGSKCSSSTSGVEVSAPALTSAIRGWRRCLIGATAAGASPATGSSPWTPSTASRRLLSRRRDRRSSSSCRRSSRCSASKRAQSSVASSRIPDVAPTTGVTSIATTTVRTMR